MDPDQGQLIVGSDPDTNCLAPHGIPEIFFFEKVDFEKKSADHKNMKYYPSCNHEQITRMQRVNNFLKKTASLSLVYRYSYKTICRLLIAFANNLDTDQARQKVGPDLDPSCLTL